MIKIVLKFILQEFENLMLFCPILISHGAKLERKRRKYNSVYACFSYYGAFKSITNALS